MTAASSDPPCPRCRGRLRHTRDRYGAYLACFVCGYHQDLGSAAAIDLAAGRADVPFPPRPPLGDQSSSHH